MENTFTGTAHLFGKNIDTDQIYPGRYLELVKPEDISMHCLEGADPDFAANVKSGDIVVAGTNFGCGSSREHAAITLKTSKVSIVIAESFARIFYRNAINLALPLIVCKGISNAVRAGDEVCVNLKSGRIENLTNPAVLQGEKLSDYAMHILEKGGIKEIFKEKTGKKS